MEPAVIADVEIPGALRLVDAQCQLYGEGSPVRVWFADESRFGLLPVYRRCWNLKGLRAHKKYQTKYQWSYCYGAIDVVNGELLCIQTPSTNLQWTEAFLKQIKKHYPKEQHVVVWDGAGFHPHHSEHPNVPEGVHIVTLPPIVQNSTRLKNSGIYYRIKRPTNCGPVLRDLNKPWPPI